MVSFRLESVSLHAAQYSLRAETFNVWLGNCWTRVAALTFDSLVARADFCRPRGPSGAFLFAFLCRSCAAKSGRSEDGMHDEDYKLHIHTQAHYYFTQCIVAHLFAACAQMMMTVGCLPLLHHDQTS